jgi:hypothetical protein
VYHLCDWRSSRFPTNKLAIVGPPGRARPPHRFSSMLTVIAAAAAPQETARLQLASFAAAIISGSTEASINIGRALPCRASLSLRGLCRELKAPRHPTSGGPRGATHPSNPNSSGIEQAHAELKRAVEHLQKLMPDATVTVTITYRGQ